MYYGKKQFNECGCEIIATFNALKDLNYNNDFSLPLLIDYFEKDGIVLNGNFGTSPKAIENFFRNLNLDAAGSPFPLAGVAAPVRGFVCNSPAPTGKPFLFRCAPHDTR